jgi:catechol 2,3-dioxygenase-like lactoylglutathione lyase family enzyme
VSGVLFAGLAVCDFEQARDFYSRVLGRPPDIPVHDTEVMWRVTDGGWLYVVLDAARAGGGLAAIAVEDLDATVAQLRARGVTPGATETVGPAERKATVVDPDGNVVSFIEVTASG